MPKPLNNLPKAKKGEDLAYSFLLKLGYKIISRNFRSRLGEIDIIAIDKNCLVFVEVKTRWTKDYGYPQEAVTSWKLNSIIKTGQYFKLLHPKSPSQERIDVLAISIRDREKANVEHIKNVTG